MRPTTFSQSHLVVWWLPHFRCRSASRSSWVSFLWAYVHPRSTSVGADIYGYNHSWMVLGVLWYMCRSCLGELYRAGVTRDGSECIPSAIDLAFTPLLASSPRTSLRCSVSVNLVPLNGACHCLWCHGQPDWTQLDKVS